MKQSRIRESGLLAFFAGFYAAIAAPAFAGLNSWTSSWQPAFAPANSLAVTPSGNSVIYAGTGFSTSLFKLTPTGWEQVWGGASGYQYVNGIAFDSGSSGTIYLAVAGANPLDSGPPVGGIYKTVDGGQTWRLLNGIDSPVSLVAADPRVEGLVYAVGGACEFIAPGHPWLCPGALFRSVDGGLTWTMQGGIAGITSLVIDPELSSTLYVTTVFGRVSVSPDGGTTWIDLSTTFGGCPVGGNLAISQSSPSVLYAQVEEEPLCPSAIYKTIDHGETWRPTTLTYAQIGPSQAPISIAVDPSDPNVVYVGTRGSLMYHSEGGGSLFRSIDGGETWSHFNQGLPDAPIYQIVVDRDRGVHVIVDHDGIFDFEYLDRIGPRQQTPRWIRFR